MLPRLRQIPTGQIMQSQFFGLSRLARIGDGQTEEDEGLTSAHFPVLAGREIRRRITEDGDIRGLCVKDAIVWIDGGDVIVNGFTSSAVTVSQLTGPKQLVGMGAKVIIWPDKVWVDTLDPKNGGYLEQVNSVTEQQVTFTPCMADGEVFDFDDYEVTAQDTPPTDPGDGDWWIDTSSVPHGLYRWSAGTGEWGGISATYIKIEAGGIGTGLNVYDGVTISGIDVDDPDAGDQLAALNGPGHPVYGAGTDYVVVAGMLDKAITATQTITVARKVPDLDYICELDNRLWGCVYGIGEDGQIVNEIHASALGVPGVWERYMGGSTDSYTVSVGSDGVFTGITSHMGQIIAWKEGCLHRIYGNGPSSYQLATIVCEGVQKDCWQSVANVNGTLLYKGRTAVWAYDGSLPENVGQELGLLRCQKAAGGAYEDTYYLSVITGNGDETYTFDTRRGIWHLDEKAYYAYYGRYYGSLVAVRQNADSTAVWDMLGRTPNAGEEEAPYTWRARFGPTGYEYAERKYLSRYNIRCCVPEGQRIRVLMQYDSEGEWHEMAYVEGHGQTNTIMIPVRPRRCDNVRLELRGGPGVRVYSVARILEIGGDGT